LRDGYVQKRVSYLLQLEHRLVAQAVRVGGAAGPALASNLIAAHQALLDALVELLLVPHELLHAEVDPLGGNRPADAREEVDVRQDVERCICGDGLDGHQEHAVPTREPEAVCAPVQVDHRHAREHGARGRVARVDACVSAGAQNVCAHSLAEMSDGRLGAAPAQGGCGFTSIDMPVGILEDEGVPLGEERVLVHPLCCRGGKAAAYNNGCANQVG
jgi:hypothetical protein